MCVNPARSVKTNDSVGDYLKFRVVIKDLSQIGLCEINECIKASEDLTKEPVIWMESSPH